MTHMHRRVLFVDDDPQLLAGLQRRYATAYDIETALSGAAAIEAIRDRGPYAVVVTDMRMPGMDGLQFIRAARGLAPETAFIMLTGNQDLQTATNALNEGQVYRFLTKPCQGNVLKSAVDEGIQRYNLLVEQRELLNETFVGSIRVLTEVLELSHPTMFGRVHAVEDIAAQFVKALGLEDRWEYKIAIQLSRVGGAVLHNPAGNSSSQEFSVAEKRKQEAEIGKHLIANIPRLRLVAEMVGRSASANGAIPNPIASDEDLVAVGATLVRASWLLDDFLNFGMNPRAITDEIKRLMPAASERFLSATLKIATAPGQTDHELGTTEVPVENLRDGMILAENLVAENGLLLIAKGARLSEATVFRLRRILGNSARRPIRVIQPPEDLALARS